MLVQTPEGNILYDCVSLLDETTVAAVRALGGIAAITLSHPHFYDAMVSWSRAFDDAPIYIPRPTASGSCARTRRSACGTVHRCSWRPG